jgi:hypothetical protein
MAADDSVSVPARRRIIGRTADTSPAPLALDSGEPGGAKAIRPTFPISAHDRRRVAVEAGVCERSVNYYFEPEREMRSTTRHRIEAGLRALGFEHVIRPSAPSERAA